MYQSKLVASLKANGKILREFKDTVYIPFGSEYSILIKNLNSVRACVNIFLDGENVVPGGLVVDPGRTVDLERWVKNGNLSEGNKFKFIERTAAIEDGPRGIKLEDGLVRIEFQFEKPRPVIQPRWVPGHYEYDQWNKSPTWNSTSNNIYPMGSTSQYKGVTDKFTVTASGAMGSATLNQVNVGGVLRGVDYSKNGEATAQAASASINQYCADNNINVKSEIHDGMATMDWMEAPTFKNDVGITVPGSKSTQSFTHVTMGEMEAEKHSIVLKLLGELENNKPVAEPVTVKAKQKCVTCNHVNKATAQFCNKCGTALTIYA